MHRNSRSSSPAPRSAGGDEAVEREAQLLARVATGDREAFSRLYRLFHPRLSRYLARFLRDSDAIQDTIHEVMLVVWRKADTFRGDSRVSTWILGIAYRKALESLRRHASRPFAVPPEKLTSLAPSEAAESADERRVFRLAVRQALDVLSPVQRAVVELTYYQGLSYREIARELECPENTVKTRMFHARRKLRRALGISES